MLTLLYAQLLCGHFLQGALLLLVNLLLLLLPVLPRCALSPSSFMREPILTYITTCHQFELLKHKSLIWTEHTMGFAALRGNTVSMAS